jgi:hypothetical protein
MQSLIAPSNHNDYTQQQMVDMEQLIDELLNPTTRSTPKRIEEVQKEIQGLQRDTAGWQLGLELLKGSSSQLRFYGALTLTIKIRTDW